MAVFKLFLLVILLAAHVSATHRDSYQDNRFSNEITAEDSTSALSNSITSVLGEFITRLVESLFDLVDLKVRTVRFLVSLYNNENLRLLKRYMNLGYRLIQWLLSVLPDSTSEVTRRVLSYFFPEEIHPEHQRIEFDNRLLDESTMPSLIHSINLDEEFVGRENNIDTQNTVDAVNPFADQVLSLDNLINARNKRK